MAKRINCEKCQNVLGPLGACDHCRGCISCCECTAMDCDCDICCQRYEIWREEQVDQGLMEPRKTAPYI